MILSDAGAPFVRENIPPPWSLARFRRIAEIAYDQTRSLRVRSFVNSLQTKRVSGMYLQVGAVPSLKIIGLAKKTGMDSERLLARNWLVEDEVLMAASYPTNLKQMDLKDFDLLAQHGYETADWNHIIYD